MEPECEVCYTQVSHDYKLVGNGCCTLKICLSCQRRQKEKSHCFGCRTPIGIPQSKFDHGARDTVHHCHGIELCSNPHISNDLAVYLLESGWTVDDFMYMYICHNLCTVISFVDTECVSQLKVFAFAGATQLPSPELIVAFNRIHRELHPEIKYIIPKKSMSGVCARAILAATYMTATPVEFMERHREITSIVRIHEDHMEIINTIFEKTCREFFQEIVMDELLQQAQLLE